MFNSEILELIFAIILLISLPVGVVVFMYLLGKVFAQIEVSDKKYKYEEDKTSSYNADKKGSIIRNFFDAIYLINNQRLSKVIPLAVFCSFIFILFFPRFLKYYRSEYTGAIIIFILYTWVFVIIEKLKGRINLKILDKLDDHDILWNFELIENRAKEILIKIVEAKTNMNPELVKGYMTDNCYNKFSKSILEINEKSHKNNIFQFKIRDINTIKISDYLDNKMDNIELAVSYTCCDYIVDEQGLYVSGDYHRSQYFTDLWKLVRVDDNWYLNEITSDLTITNLIATSNFIETSS